MYCTVPISCPTSVCRVVTAMSLSVVRATPKSITFTMPAPSTRMLLGFRSRWMMPRWCPCAIASQACRNRRSRSRVESFASRAYSVIGFALAMYSIANHGVAPSASRPASRICAMPGCRSRPSTCASNSKRRSADALVMPRDITLIATVRRGLSWRAS